MRSSPVDRVSSLERRSRRKSWESRAVAAVVRYTGTGKATGKKLDLPVVHVWKVRNGKVEQFRQFIDTAKFLEVVPG
jgi:ketosteroid isomerase-like protein